MFNKIKFTALKGVEQIGVTDYLNSNWSIEWPRDFTAAGTNWNYRRPNNKPEYLSAKGPTDRDLILAVSLKCKTYAEVINYFLGFKVKKVS